MEIKCDFGPAPTCVICIFGGSAYSAFSSECLQFRRGSVEISNNVDSIRLEAAVLQFRIGGFLKLIYLVVEIFRKNLFCLHLFCRSRPGRL